MKLRTLVLVNFDVTEQCSFARKPYLYESDKCSIDEAKYAMVRTTTGMKLAKVLNVVSTCDENVLNALMNATGAHEPLRKITSVFTERIVEEEGETNE